METRLSLMPGQNGTKKLLATYGERLVCVRYRYDAKREVRHKTVELIVETTPWHPRARNARRVKRVGGIWRPHHKLWEVDWKTVCAIGLKDRVVTEGGETPIYP